MKMILVEWIKNPSTWLSLFTILMTIVSLFLTNKQIKTSNKQALFDRRLDKYLFINDLIRLYEKNRSEIINESNIHMMVDMCFVNLTNCVKLEGMANALSNPFDEDSHRLFLTKCEEIKKTAIEIKALWGDRDIQPMSDFINAYESLLMGLYKQKIALYKIENNQNKPTISEDEFKNETLKYAEMIGLYEKIIKIDNIYKNMINKKTEIKIKESIKIYKKNTLLAIVRIVKEKIVCMVNKLKNIKINKSNNKKEKNKKIFEEFKYAVRDLFLIISISTSIILLQGINMYLKVNVGVSILFMFILSLMLMQINSIIKEMEKRSNLEIAMCIVVAIASSLNNFL